MATKVQAPKVARSKQLARAFTLYKALIESDRKTTEAFCALTIHVPELSIKEAKVFLSTTKAYQKKFEKLAAKVRDTADLLAWNKTEEGKKDGAPLPWRDAVKLREEHDKLRSQLAALESALA